MIYGKNCYYYGKRISEDKSKLITQNKDTLLPSPTAKFCQGQVL